MNPKSYAIIGTIALCMTGIGTLSQHASAELSGEIQIGAIGSLTGKQAFSGEENKIGYELAVDDFNAYLAEKGAGWFLSITSEDSQASPAVTLEKIQALHARNIKHVIGPQASANLQNIKSYVDSNNMMIISCCSTSPLLSIEGDSIFRLAPDDTNQAVAIAKLLESGGIEIIVPVWRQDAWGVGLETAIREAFPARGGTVDEGIGYSPEIDDFSSSASILAEIVQGYVDEYGAENVGVAYFGFGEAQLFFQSASIHDVLSKVRWFGADANTKDPGLVEDPISLEFVTDTEFTTVLVASGKNEISKRVEEAVDADLGRIPRTYASSAYDAIWILGLSMEKIQSTDVTLLIATIPKVAAEHRGALGSVRLNSAGDLAQTNYDIWNISDGQWKFAGVYYAASDAINLDGVQDGMTEDKTAEGGCLIATAAYGSELAPQVQFLREIRDRTLLSTASGASFMTGFNQVYYSFSPAIADLERENPIFRDMVRAAITPAMYTMNIMTLADPGSEVSALVFGMLSIGAIAGIYVAGPYLTVRAVSRKVRQSRSN